MARRVHERELRERRRQKSQDEPSDLWDFELVAFSEEGEVLYRTEGRKTREGIKKAADRANQMLADGKDFEYEGESVDRFVAVESGTMDEVT